MTIYKTVRRPLIADAIAESYLRFLSTDFGCFFVAVGLVFSWFDRFKLRPLFSGTSLFGFETNQNSLEVVSVRYDGVELRADLGTDFGVRRD